MLVVVLLDVFGQGVVGAQAFDHFALKRRQFAALVDQQLGNIAAAKIVDQLAADIVVVADIRIVRADIVGQLRPQVVEAHRVLFLQGVAGDGVDQLDRLFLGDRQVVAQGGELRVGHVLIDRYIPRRRRRFRHHPPPIRSPEPMLV